MTKEEYIEELNKIIENAIKELEAFRKKVREEIEKKDENQ